MISMNRFHGIVMATGLVFTGTLVDGVFDFGVIIGDAQAIVGRPLTPASYAGVARRTTRRVVRRTTVTVAALPVGCTTVVIEGVSLHQCGATYYQTSGTQYVVVKVD